ncbi:MAG: bifunctional methionine sulfoxide reductase B/A protein [Planctomycetota bacterium]
MPVSEPDWAKLTDAQWKQRLTPEQYDVLRRHGTEPAFCGGYSTFKANGIGDYACTGCGLKLFTSDTAFDSGTGWPSFFKPVPGAVASSEDNAYGMKRIEVHCARCSGHLGHQFDDGPAPTGQRYCINAVSLVFQARAAKSTTQTATFAAGCFWGVEAVLRAVPGVVDAQVGYMGGKTKNPTYRDVCTDETGHAEVCQVTFDPTKVSYVKLLTVFFENHDPTTMDRQGPDVGNQYRSAVFTHDDHQRKLALAYITAINASHRLPRPVVTVVESAPTFWKAEDYHQNYAAKNGHGACHLPHGRKFGDLESGIQSAAQTAAATK